jgi:2-amino-4-hydroxy-6-hydroxymethyldihydropteridine diphosphokinase
LRAVIRVVRLSVIEETAPVDAPAGSPMFLNAVALGYTTLGPRELMDTLLAIEKRLGRVRRGPRNAPRVIDLDLIVHGGHRVASESLTLPHPRAAWRTFVVGPMRALGAGAWLPDARAERQGNLCTRS